MRSRDISKNNKPIQIYKRLGSILKKPICRVKSEESSYIPKHILKNRENVETKLSMGMLSPQHNSLKIAKYQRILNNIDLMIENRILGGESSWNF